jgi:hypothetical protein
LQLRQRANPCPILAYVVPAASSPAVTLTVSVLIFIFVLFLLLYIGDHKAAFSQEETAFF